LIPETTERPFFRKISLILITLAFVLAVIGMTGWLTGSLFMKSFLSDGATMKFNTALMLLFASLATWSFALQRSRLGYLFTFLLLLFAVVPLLEFGWGTLGKFDQLFVTDHDTNPLREPPGRTSILTAANGILIGLSLLALRCNYYRSSQFFAIISFLSVYSALLGHLFGATDFYSWGHYSGIAFHTAMALGAINLAVLLSQSAKGWLRVFLQPIKGRITLKYLVVYLILVLPILIALYILLVNRNAISVTSSIILVVIITIVLSLPVAYVFLNQVSVIDDDLQRVNQKLSIALGAGKFGSYDLDLASGLMLCSDQCKANFGLPAGAELNFPDLISAIRPEYRDDVQQKVGAAIAGHSLYEASYQIAWPDGSLHWISASGMPQYDQYGTATSIIGITYDITEQRENDLRKNAFIGMVSHEMKTPLTSVKAYVQVLRQRAEKGGQEFEVQALSKVDQQLVKMTRMINGFLNVSRLESGQIQLERSTFDLAELIREITDETTLTLTSHEITFDLQAITISADRDKIGQVINNLVTNGIKYSPGKKVIHIYATADEKSATVRISDNGMGVVAADLNKVFERFYRSDAAHHQHISGFGIGLYLSAEIIRLHDGKIWAESVIGVGSEFCFSLPR